MTSCSAHVTRSTLRSSSLRHPPLPPLTSPIPFDLSSQVLGVEYYAFHDRDVAPTAFLPDGRVDMPQTSANFMQVRLDTSVCSKP